MKRASIAVLLLLLVAAVVYGATSISVNPSEMKNGETKSLVDGRNTITITRNGDDLNVKVEGAALTRSLSITRSGDEIRIERAGVHGGMFVMPDVPLMKPRVFREKIGTQEWFVCPKDHTMLRVPDGKEDQTFKCPVDGTTMEKRTGRGFFFGDFDTDSLL